MKTDNIQEESLNCTQCEALGEISFPNLQRSQENVLAKISINNLPEDMEESGIKNLFVSIGKPIRIEFHPKKCATFVEFQSRNEAELAFRDLNGTQPYLLKVSLILPKAERELKTKEKKQSWKDEGDQFASAEIDTSNLSHRISLNKDLNKKNPEKTYVNLKKENTQLQAALKSSNYDPSIRMRQKKLDFQRKWHCVSFGRGYYLTEEKNCPIGGLQTFTITSKKCSLNNEMDYSCENCQSLTVRFCEKSRKPYCSLECLNKKTSSLENSYDGISLNRAEENFKCHGTTGEGDGSSFLVVLYPDDFSNEEYGALESGCDVIIPTYCTLQTVFVRRTDGPWEELFVKLNNDVAVAAMRDESKMCPRVGDQCIAKFHQDFCFYRAEVCSLERNNKATVIFVDFGNTQTTDVEDLRPLPAHLKQILGLAIKVQLKNVQRSSSLESVDYLNKLTAERIPLVMKFENLGEGVVLIEKDTKQEVNKLVASYALPLWKRDESSLSKLGETFLMASLKLQMLEVGKKYNLYLSHLDEKEFVQLNVLWVVLPDADDYYHVVGEMKEKMEEYCEFLKGDCYLPRVNELCLAKEKGEWHRCVNLRNHKTTCFLFFLDDGHSSNVDTSNIRKMIRDFTEAPSQAICCKLSDDLQHNLLLESKITEWLKGAVGRTLNSVHVDEFQKAVYFITVPEIEKLCT